MTFEYRFPQVVMLRTGGEGPVDTDCQGVCKMFGRRRVHTADLTRRLSRGYQRK